MTHPQVWLAGGLAAAVAAAVLLSGSWVPLLVVGAVVAFVAGLFVDW